MDAIIKPSEVAGFTGIKLPFNPCDFAGAYNYEVYEFRKCLGLDFRDDLVAALTDFSSANEYDPEATYNQDDLAKYKSVYYKAKSNGVTSLPTVAADWSLAPKFSDADYEDLYCYYLGPYLGLSILARRLPFIISQITDEGVLSYNGSEYETSDTKSIERLQSSLYADRQIVYDNMDAWLTHEDRNEEVKFSNYPKNKSAGNDCKSEPCETNPLPTYGGYRF
jgi:hypothetical protein